MEAIYTASAIATGDGRNGRVRSSDGILDLNLAIPKEMGGPGGAHSNPEMLFASGYSACFHSALKVAARMKKIALGDTTVTVEVGIGSNGQGGYQLQAAIEVQIPDVDEATARELIEAAHQICPYSNATRGNIEVTLNLA
ncbi:Ohr family peroxiredoxin [Streptomyces sp. NPDC008092]|uniref:organic hydroperoxide resistance protein n=1 Tax=Streptomyces sp. NPDC008092 TaxID=3364808 RepID=UPI0036EF6431